MPVQCTCLTCGATFSVSPGRIAAGGGKYCSQACNGAARRGAYWSSVVVACPICDAPVITSSSRPRVYCSRACFGISQRGKPGPTKGRSFYVLRSCENCGAQFSVRPSAVKQGGGKYCSHACSHVAHTTPRLNRACAFCHQPFITTLVNVRRGGGKYCSPACAHMGQRRRVDRQCGYCGVEFNVTPSKIRSGAGKYCSNTCQGLAYRERGEPGARYSTDYREWRTVVFERDAFACQDCGQRGGRLHAHHVKMWRDYPELRFDVDNGVTLCATCHAARHAWMRSD